MHGVLSCKIEMCPYSVTLVLTLSSQDFFTTGVIVFIVETFAVHTEIELNNTLGHLSSYYKVCVHSSLYLCLQRTQWVLVEDEKDTLKQDIPALCQLDAGMLIYVAFRQREGWDCD